VARSVKDLAKGFGAKKGMTEPYRHEVTGQVDHSIPSFQQVLEMAMETGYEDNGTSTLTWLASPSTLTSIPARMSARFPCSTNFSGPDPASGSTVVHQPHGLYLSPCSSVAKGMGGMEGTESTDSGGQISLTQGSCNFRSHEVRLMP